MPKALTESQVNQFRNDGFLFPYDVYTPEEADRIAFESDQGQNFRTLLFTKIVPNLKRIGLLTDNVKEKYEQIGVLSYAELEDNFNIDWAEMSKPYETQEEIEKAIRLV